jgi:hypothetical protein
MFSVITNEANKFNHSLDTDSRVTNIYLLHLIYKVVVLSVFVIFGTLSAMFLMATDWVSSKKVENINCTEIPDGWGEK